MATSSPVLQRLPDRPLIRVERPGCAMGAGSGLTRCRLRSIHKEAYQKKWEPLVADTDSETELEPMP
jgi:hypothetical protein